MDETPKGSPDEGFDNIENPISPMMQMAIVMHEAYSAFVSAGFDDDQSMQLIMHMAEMGSLDERDDD